MICSTFDIFTIGIGPSSSHTIGPIKAANHFVAQLDIEQINRINVTLYGSLALTGRGHNTDNAILFGLSGHTPEQITTAKIEKTISQERETKTIALNQRKTLPFNLTDNILFDKKNTLPLHSNGIKFTANLKNGSNIQNIYYSIGGGFITDEKGSTVNTLQPIQAPLPFATATELISLCTNHKKSIAEIMSINEQSRLSENQLMIGIAEIWKTMNTSIDKGLNTTGVLPGLLNVTRRANPLYRKLLDKNTLQEDERLLDWLSVYAIAVTEENAAGGKIVTAPTNGASGIIPSALRHHLSHSAPTTTNQTIETFLLTAAAIGILYKTGASFSAAEVGCQGEVGVACSMAAGALTAVNGGTIQQVENAAEIGMEHNLGLTCDPVGGLVQIPCIERNAMGAVKAVNASRLALNSDGHHIVSLDKVIATMLRTGKDMQTQYKETSLGGLAVQVNMPEC